MNKHCLQSQSDSTRVLAHFFAQLTKINSANKPFASLEVNEDECFGLDNWLSVGNIFVYAGQREPQDEDEYSSFVRALKLGSYDWKLSTSEELLTGAMNLIPDDTGDKKEKREKREEKTKSKLSRALESIANVGIRCGLAHPVFDAASFINMPFTRPTTIVADTNSVLQGGLDFVVRFLYPTARIKIPAIVHMEILNFVDRYLSQRRNRNSNKGSLLLDHVNSQGGQRVLLRLELQTDAEIERPRIGADPLRGIVQPDSDHEDKTLGLQNVQRSFADRLILETAIQHRERLSPDHPVMLLTCDQGLARMTLAEGMHPLFFDKNHTSQLFGSMLTGTCFRPFIGRSHSERLYSVPFTELLWELAVTFGAARLRDAQSESYVEVRAMGSSLSWNPFHARDDLLWLRWEKIDSYDSVLQSEHIECKTIKKDLQPETSGEVSKDSKLLAKQPLREPLDTLKGSYKFNLTKMILLIQAFYNKQSINDNKGVEIVGVKTVDNYSKYRNFLRSGNFITYSDNKYIKTHRIDTFWEALRNQDYLSIQSLLDCIPSFHEFIEELKSSSPLSGKDVLSISKTAFHTYSSLAEMSCFGLNIHPEGVYDTTYQPPLDVFANISLHSYRGIARGEEYVLTGQWLEHLAKEYRIHPVTARDRLNEARQAGYLERYTEGSTPETQYETHTMTYLHISNGLPVVTKINLYHGDFLIQDRASVSIRIEGKMNEASGEDT
jgi:hypothetical protein